jgi:hypothetical protein
MSTTTSSAATVGVYTEGAGGRVDGLRIEDEGLRMKTPANAILNPQSSILNPAERPEGAKA